MHPIALRRVVGHQECNFVHYLPDVYLATKESKRMQTKEAKNVQVILPNQYQLINRKDLSFIHLT